MRIADQCSVVVSHSPTSGVSRGAIRGANSAISGSSEKWNSRGAGVPVIIIGKDSRAGRHCGVTCDVGWQPIAWYLGVDMSGERYTRDEDLAQQLDRHWLELLQELRVAQTGVQILFAFLLVVAFSGPFQDADGFTHGVFSVTLVVTAMATGLLIAPVSVHRLVYRRWLRPQLVRTASRMAMGGLLLMLIAVAGGLLLALDIVLPRGVAIAIVVVVVVWFVGFWYVVPLALRRSAR